MTKIYFRRVIQVVSILFCGSLLSVSAASYSQTMNLTGKKIPFNKVVNAIRQQSGYTIFSSKSLLDQAEEVNIEAKNMPLKDFLESIVAGKSIAYQIEDKTISFSSKATPTLSTAILTNKIAEQELRTITGKVTNAATGAPISLVTVHLKDEKISASTKPDGEYTISIPANYPNPILVYSFVGMKPVEYTVRKQQRIHIELEETFESIKDVVITGIYQRKKESFTGSSSTYTAKELKMIGNQNILQSLKTLEPAFAIVDNNLFGSNPNRLPDIEIRGKSSVIGLSDEYGSNPNQPLFILDGFESNLRTISDFSMDRIESITILKDAAATAIYGSKAANGVVVVETKRIIPGELKINYNLSSSISFADLSDYNLMNAAEKLEYERLTSFYGALDKFGNIIPEAGQANYSNRLKEVARGVDTYWVNESLRTALSQRHTLSAEGGDGNLRYNASLSYGDTKGVMKFSSREVINGNIRLLYRKGKISFANSLNVDYTTANQEPISFGRFARTNPYHRKYNEIGEVDKLMEKFEYLDISTFTRKNIAIFNPLFDMENNNLDKNSLQGINNSFEMDWRILSELRFRSRIGIRNYSNKTVVFRSPFNSQFEGLADLEKGTYSESNGREANYDGDLALTYGKLLNQKHMVNAVLGGRIEQASNSLSMYNARGFVDDEFANPIFAFGYPQSARPTYLESKRRSASVFINTGYAYDERFLLDATLRADGSSVFGSSKQFTSIWALGLAWNIHNESFFRETNLDWVNLLKIRSSIGNPGNQNFNDYISTRVYRYNTDNINPFGSSVVLSNFGNNALKWQKTLDRNIGLDLEVMDKKLRINIDYFNKKTDPLLVFVTLPTSTGTDRVAQNLGGQSTKGFTLITDYTLLKKEQLNWRINLNMRQVKSRYYNIDNSLDEYNTTNKSRNLIRYYNGGSPSDLWAVRSQGIDPATGREIFLNKQGKQTFVHNYDDEVIVGNSEPKLEGVFGTNFYYKGFTAGIYLRYRLGGQVFMQSLYEKVENVTMANIMLNQDKRALHDRWRNPGDLAKFKAISQTEYTPISSRFVEDNNVLSGESISFGYETMNKAWLNSIGASSITLKAYMNDIFRVSTIKNERGIDYPFARSVSFSLGLRF